MSATGSAAEATSLQGKNQQRQGSLHFWSKKNRPSSLHSGRDSKAQASEPDSTLVSGLRKPKYVQVFSGFAMSHLH